MGSLVAAPRGDKPLRCGSLNGTRQSRGLKRHPAPLGAEGAGVRGPTPVAAGRRSCREPPTYVGSVLPRFPRETEEKPLGAAGKSVEGLALSMAMRK